MQSVSNYLPISVFSGLYVLLQPGKKYGTTTASVIIAKKSIQTFFLDLSDIWYHTCTLSGFLLLNSLN
jgi:hypothetical protein